MQLFFVLTLYPATLLNSFISTKSFFVCVRGLQRFLHITSYHFFRYNFTSSFPIWKSLISFSRVIALARTSSTTLSGSGESSCPCLSPQRRRFQYFTVKHEVSCGFVVCGFYYVEVVSYYSYFIEWFYHEWVLNSVRCFFCIGWDDRVIFPLYSLMCGVLP